MHDRVVTEVDYSLAVTEFIEGQTYEFYGDLETDETRNFLICRALMACPCENIDLFLINDAAEYIYKFFREK